MPIEILAYSPKNVQEFIDFAIRGVPDGQGGFETDPGGRPIIGVLRWLNGRQVPEARFFSTPPNHPIRLFMALIQRPEPIFVPWMSFIPGIEERIQIDGLIGEISDFPPNPPGDLLAAVIRSPQLDAAFVAGRTKVQHVLDRIDAEPGRLRLGTEPMTKDDLLKALERGIKVNEVFDEVQSKLGISL